MRAFLQRYAGWWPPLVALLVVIMPVFGHLDALPIHMWDESRLATNAQEMAYGINPHPFVTTFGGEPDMWNTKPPLLIWIQATAIQLFGPGEISIRLPSALAALCTAWLLYRLGARRLRRPWLGTAAVTVLMTSAGYISNHGTRTGDYDAMLSFFTTAYGLAWWAYLEEPQKKKWFYLAILGLVGAAMTKGVAGLLATPSLLVYTLYRRHLGRVLRSPHTYIGALIFCVVVAAYYLGREQVNPGYIDAVLANDLGRYGEAIEGHIHEWEMYFTSLFTTKFSAWVGWWVIGLVLAHWRLRDAALRRAVVFAALFCGVHLAVITSAGTRIEWYDIPTYPYAAFVAAAGVYLLLGLARRGMESWRENSPSPKMNSAAAHLPQRPYWQLSVLSTALFIGPYCAIYDFVANHRLHEGYDNFENIAMATRLSRTIKGQMAPPADVYVWRGYLPNLDYYLSVMRHRGMTIAHTGSLDSVRVGQTIAVWQPELLREAEERFTFNIVENFMDRARVYRLVGTR